MPIISAVKDEREEGDLFDLRLFKDGHSYVFLYTEEHKDELPFIFDRFAENSELNFSEVDAQALIRTIEMW